LEDLSSTEAEAPMSTIGEALLCFGDGVVELRDKQRGREREGLEK